MTYQSNINNGNYGSFSDLSAARLIDRSLASGVVHGYRYTLTTVVQTSSTPAFFKLSAIPERYGITGTRSFFIDESGILRSADKRGEPADENDLPVTY